MKIPKDFCREDHGPVVCDTVGDVIEELKRLPKNLQIRQGFGEGVRLIVYNASTDPELQFEEADDDQ